jgi:hypothetical protein
LEGLIFLNYANRNTASSNLHFALRVFLVVLSGAEAFLQQGYPDLWHTHCAGSGLISNRESRRDKITRQQSGIARFGKRRKKLLRLIKVMVQRAEVPLLLHVIITYQSTVT